jgi:hypothetical protein
LYASILASGPRVRTTTPLETCAYASCTKQQSELRPEGAGARFERRDANRLWPVRAASGAKHKGSGGRLRRAMLPASAHESAVERRCAVNRTSSLRPLVGPRTGACMETCVLVSPLLISRKAVQSTTSSARRRACPTGQWAPRHLIMPCLSASTMARLVEVTVSRWEAEAFTHCDGSLEIGLILSCDCERKNKWRNRTGLFLTPGGEQNRS